MPKPEKIERWECLILATTDKARRVRYEGENYWLPRSQILNDEDVPERGDTVVELPQWLAEKKLDGE